MVLVKTAVTQPVLQDVLLLVHLSVLTSVIIAV